MTTEYPKLWNGASAGGEAGVRHLQTFSPQWQFKAGPGFIGRTKGEFSEVLVDEPRGDGWFSNSNASINPIRLRGTASQNTGFTPLGNIAEDFGLAGGGAVFPSGDGWGYTNRTLEDLPGFRLMDVSKTFTGGKTNIHMFEILVGKSEIDATAIGVVFHSTNWYPGDHLWLALCPQYVEEDIVRQKPDARGAVLDVSGDEPEWIGIQLTLPAFDPNVDYTFPEFITLLPAVWCFVWSKVGEYPTMDVTPDLGATWAEYDMTPFFPGATFGTVTPEASMPGATLEAKRTNYVAQGSVQHYIGAAHPSLSALSLRRVLVRTFYLSGSDFISTVTLFDVFAGVIENQWTYTGDRVVIPIGENSWLEADFVTDGTPRNRIQNVVITLDSGATFEPVTPEPDTRWPAFVIMGAMRPDTPFYPTIYYVVEKGGVDGNPPTGFGGRKELWRTSNNYTDNEKASLIAPQTDVTDSPRWEDFDVVSYIGMPHDPAAIDNCVPWRVDSRFAIPEWWYDGIPH